MKKLKAYNAIVRKDDGKYIDVTVFGNDIEHAMQEAREVLEPRYQVCSVYSK